MNIKIMRTEYQIAKRISQSNNNADKTMSKPAIKVAFLGIVIGIMIMILTIFIAIVFKRAVTEKVSGFGGDIRVVNYDKNLTYEMQPIIANDSLIHKILNVSNVNSAEVFITKPAMIKTNDSFEGVVLKGYVIDSTQNIHEGWQFFQDCLTDGHLPKQNQDIIISKTTATRLKLKVGNSIFCYFINEQIRARKLNITGIYDSGFEEADRQFVVGNIKLVQQLNGWNGSQVSGVEIRIKDFSKLDQTTTKIYYKTANVADSDGNFLDTQDLRQLNVAIFSWLALLDMDVLVIILLMLIVSGFNIISGLIILILDHVQLIGTLKALGADNTFISKIFLWQSLFLLIKGLFWGNILGLTLALLQYLFHIIPLDSTTYYVSYVPICFHWGWWLLLNLGTLIISMLILLIPTQIIARISPSEVMKFD